MNPNPVISFFVPGVPQPGGSKRAFVNKKTGRAIVTEDCKRNKPWRSVVVGIAMQALGTAPPLAGPLVVEFTFFILRPKGHFGSGRNSARLKPSAPGWPVVKPDTTKLVRAVEDALTGIAWVDDALIVEQVARKVYGPRPGVRVVIEAKHRPGDELPADVEVDPSLNPQVWRSATAEDLSA